MSEQKEPINDVKKDVRDVSDVGEKLVNSVESKIITKTRTWIAVIIFTSLLLLGIPLCISTTKIYRANLPIDQINQFDYKFQLQFKIPINLSFDQGISGGDQNVYDQQLKTRYPNLNIWSIEVVNTVNPENYNVRVHLGVKPSYNVSLYDKQIDVYVTKDTNVDEYISQVLYDSVFEYELNNIESTGHPTVAFPYSSKFNIVFSLLVENGIQTTWEIEPAIEQFKTLLNSLNHIANFSITSQVQYYSKLSKRYQKSNNDSYILHESDLPTFINFGDWNLDNYDINPTINFLVYFPKSNYEGIPLRIENTKTNSFLIPQWGGVAIFNKQKPILKTNVTLTSDELVPVMNIFASQLYQLLGVPPTPKNPNIRIDSLSRLLIVSNIKKSLDNLISLIKLANTLNEITIPEETKQSVDTSLTKIHEVIELVQQRQFKLAMVSSSGALIASERAFFEKKMVQQAYFPSDHKLAVFLPLLGPIGSILLFGILKLITDFKNKRKEKKKQE